MTNPPPAPETGALIYWFDISAAIVDDWLHWYLRDHMPSRVGTTFTTGRCFEAIAGPTSHMVMFETTTPEALLAPDYLKLLGTVSDEDRKRRGWYSNTVRMTARVQRRMGTGIGSVLAVTRFDHTPHPEGPRAETPEPWPIDEIGSLPGVGSIWFARHDASIRARMDQVRVTGHQDQSPHGALLIESARDTDAQQAQAIVHAQLSRQAPDAAAGACAGRYRLLYAMTAWSPRSDLSCAPSAETGS